MNLNKNVKKYNMTSTTMKLDSRSDHIAYTLLGITAVMWGGTSVAGKLALTSIPPFTAVGIRSVLALIVLILLLKRQEGFSLPARCDWPMFMILGLTGVFGTNALLFSGLKYSTATNASLILSCSPIVITILSVFILKERIVFGQVFGILISFLGVLIVVSKGSLALLMSLDFNVGDILLLGNPISWGFYSVLMKKLLDRYSPLAIGTYSNLVGVIFFPPFIIYELATAQAEIHLTAVSFGAIAYVGLLASSVGTLWWNKGIKQVGASRASIFMNGVPISAMLLSVVVLGERIGLPQILGAVMVLAGVYFNSLRGRSHKLLW